MTMPLLTVDSLFKHFPVGARPGPWARYRGAPDRVPMLHAVDGVSFSIQKGETLGLVGESGCGKSTLVRLITRLLDPTDGAIRLLDQDIGAISAARFGQTAMRPRIQMVFQDPTDSLNPRFTAFDTIADPIRRLKPLPPTALRKRVDDLADMCGLPRALLARFPHQLSGGQKARVGIARAISLEPELLVLDEPTAALDVSVQVVILQLLDELRQSLGMSYLFVSHDLNVVRLLCDRVMVMYLGKIVEIGPAHDVFEAPRHPYTRALLSAIPHFDPDRKISRLHISGEPRSPIDPSATTCRFFGRCPKGYAHCTEVMPVLTPAGTSHMTACHDPEGGPSS